MILREVKEVLRRGIQVDYVTFVPNGEPTLDTEIGRAAQLIASLGLHTAVITNSSLLWREDVRSDLHYFSLVSIKIDTVNDKLWRKLNRPHEDLDLSKVLKGIEEFCKEYRGVMLTETMLVRGLNTSEEEARATARFIRRLDPSKVYISVPVRPPTEPWVKPPTEEEIVVVYTTFTQELGRCVELLTSPEPPRFEVLDNPREYLLNLTSVHPLRYDYAVKALSRVCEEPERLIQCLIREGVLALVEYQGQRYLVRRRPGRE